MSNQQPSLEFYASAEPLNQSKKFVIAITDGHVLTRVGEANYPDGFLLTDKDFDQLQLFLKQKILIGQWKDHDCEVWDLTPDSTAAPDLQLVELRSLLAHSTDSAFSLASRAVQLVQWSNTHKYCSRCSGPLSRQLNEHAMHCKDCNVHFYPRISPCIIVIVTHKDKCLLARQSKWPEGRYSALAGFIEAGESAEQAVHREVYEEVGIEIDDLRYVGSQSWPFPGQLMLGFMAKAKSQEICIDGIEISDAQWWHYQQLPEFIPPVTIMAGRLIQSFIDEVSKQ